MGLRYVIHRKDSNSDAIVGALRDLGVEVFYWGGKGNADVVTRYVHAGRESYLPLDFKVEKGKRRESQKDKPWPFVTTVAEAWDHIRRRAR